MSPIRHLTSTFSFNLLANLPLFSFLVFSTCLLRRAPEIVALFHRWGFFYQVCLLNGLNPSPVKLKLVLHLKCTANFSEFFDRIRNRYDFRGLKQLLVRTASDCCPEEDLHSFSNVVQGSELSVAKNEYMYVSRV